MSENDKSYRDWKANRSQTGTYMMSVERGRCRARWLNPIVSGWMKSARGDDAPSGAQGIYQDMADETMTASLVDGGTFGLAGTMYAQLSTLLQGGAAPPPLVPPADTPTPTDPTAGALPTDAPSDQAGPTDVLQDDPGAGGDAA